MGLFGKRGLHSSDPRVRLAAVEKASDEDLLEAACGDDSPRVRLAAVARISDDANLARVAKEAGELDVRLAAVERISSQQLLAEIIKTRKNFKLMGACFARITDKKILEAIASDTGYNPTARRIAVEQFADESYLADIEGKQEADGEDEHSKVDIEALMRMYGGVRMVRAIGRFRRSEKALRALGKVAKNGGEAGELAVEYLCRALASTNPALRNRATKELSALSDPDLVGCLVRAVDDPRLSGPIRDVLTRIGTSEARAALEGLAESAGD